MSLRQDSKCIMIREIIERELFMSLASSPFVILVIGLLHVHVSIFNNSCSRLQILFAERLQFVHRMSAPGEWAVPESLGMGAYVSAQYCSFRQILQRSYHNGIRNRNLGSGSIGGQTFGTPRGITWTKGLIFFFLRNTNLTLWKAFSFALSFVT